MPYNNPIKKKSSSCMQMKDYKGKPVGLMMEGSVNHMSMLHKETDKQEKENLEGPKGENPIDNRGVGQMSPYKMSHGDSPNKMSPLNDNHDIDPKTGKKITYRLKGTSDMYDAEGFLKPEYSGASQAAQDAEYGIILSDLNKITRGRTFSTGDEERDFEYRSGGYRLRKPAGTRERDLYPGARGTGTVISSTTRQYTPEEMRNIVQTTREYNRPKIEATKRFNEGDYTQEQIDIYNKMQRSGATDYVNPWYRSPGSRTKNPRLIFAKG